MALAAILAIGAGVVWALFAAWIVGIVEGSLSEPEERFTGFMVLADGTPLVQRYKTGNSTSILQSLEGEERPLLLDHRVRSLPGVVLPATVQPMRGAAPDDIDWTGRTAALYLRGEQNVNWYVVRRGARDEEAAYFVGYDRRSKLPVVYVGTHGFRRDVPPPEQRFDATAKLVALSAYTMQSTAYLVSHGQLLAIDFGRETVQTLGEIGPVVAIRFFDVMPEMAIYSQPCVALRTPNEVVLYYPTAREKRAYVIPEELAGTVFAFYRLPDGKALAAVTDYRRAGNTGRLVWFDQAGNVSRRFEVEPGTPMPLSSDAASVTVACWAVPSPLTALAGFAILATEGRMEGHESTYLAGLARAVRNAWPPLVGIVFLAVGFAAIVHRRQRCYAQPRTAAWVAFVFLFGLPGLVGYWLHRGWPTRLACPACKTSVPRDRGECAHCGAAFPPSAPKGIEIFTAG
jgi:hypothetical protein